MAINWLDKMVRISAWFVIVVSVIGAALDITGGTPERVFGWALGIFFFGGILKLTYH